MKVSLVSALLLLLLPSIWDTASSTKESGIRGHPLVSTSDQDVSGSHDHIVDVAKEEGKIIHMRFDEPSEDESDTTGMQDKFADKEVTMDNNESVEGYVWSACFKNEDASSKGIKGGRDEMGRRWCVERGYSGWDKYQDCGGWKFKFRCTPDWSACFKDEDAKKEGIQGGRDEMGRRWCLERDYLGWTDWKDCGGWKFKFLCSTKFGDDFWSPCLSDEEARSRNFENRDEYGKGFCRTAGFGGYDKTFDCKGGKFRFKCAKPLKKWVTVKTPKDKIYDDGVKACNNKGYDKYFYYRGKARVHCL